MFLTRSYWQLLEFDDRCFYPKTLYTVEVPLIILWDEWYAWGKLLHFVSFVTREYDYEKCFLLKVDVIMVKFKMVISCKILSLLLPFHYKL